MYAAVVEQNGICKEAFALGMLDPYLPEHKDLLMSAKGNQQPPTKNIPGKPRLGNRGGMGAPPVVEPTLTPVADGGMALTHCFKCGRPHRGLCSLRDHPDCNRYTTIPWHDSVQGKAWAKKGESVLPYKKTLSGEKFASKYYPANTKSEYCCAKCTYSDYLLSMASNESTDDDFVSCNIIVQDNKVHPIINRMVETCV